MLKRYSPALLTSGAGAVKVAGSAAKAITSMIIGGSEGEKNLTTIMVMWRWLDLFSVS